MEAKAIELIQSTAVKANGDPLPEWLRQQLVDGVQTVVGTFKP